MMPQSIMADLFTALGMLVVERLPDNSLRVLGTLPDWLARVYPDISFATGTLVLGTESPFLENFLIDAETFWRAQSSGVLRSGIWTETDPSGAEAHLEASAVCVGPRQILLVELLGPSYAEKQNIIQVGREAKLSLTERHRAVAALQEAVATLEARLAERTAELARANEQMNRQLAERKHAKASLQQSEEQLRHIQKMQTLGQLAAGIARDFNDALTVIMGSCDHLAVLCGQRSDLRKHLEYITKATERAALLTHQLLAISSGQLLAPQVLHLNVVLTNINTLLRRLMDEGIEVRLLLDPELGQVRADTGQIEQVIMSLAVYARDAMPSGGKLTIRTANVEVAPDTAHQLAGCRPGSYVMLAISDTGFGMDPETRARIFKPSLVTKEPGKGTALGLSTAYTIVRESGGDILVTSELGRGSEFMIYLPRVEEELQRPKPGSPLAMPARNPDAPHRIPPQAE
jgi:signal transduction histidine kinase